MHSQIGRVGSVQCLYILYLGKSSHMSVWLVVDSCPIMRLAGNWSLMMSLCSTTREDCIQLSACTDLQCFVGGLPCTLRVDEYATTVHCQNQPYQPF